MNIASTVREWDPFVNRFNVINVEHSVQLVTKFILQFFVLDWVVPLCQFFYPLCAREVLADTGTLL